jgi:hypothetical protein
MNEMHENGRFPTWLAALLLTIILLTLGVQTAFAGFCWAG